ncbi:lipopolysaccharide heptosyltransferase II [Desulfobulbus sp. F4]|nr:lipopolysaccharide heptosyltransferase II [Desulfobulbus sp. F3]MCW5200568.1 lipopolysaccharide heptosyltransferase II [Desulfobulbus sp. F4]
MNSATNIPAFSRRILVRSTNWIGDAVMTTPAVRTIRRNFPEAEITLLAQPWVADVFSACPHIDRIFLYKKHGQHSGVRGKLRLAAELRAECFDVAILLQNAFEAALLTALARIPARAGYTTDGRGLLLTHGVRKSPGIGSKHQVHYYQEMLAGLGLQLSEDAPELFLDPGATQEAAVLLSKALEGRSVPVIGLNPGAAYGPAKCWPSTKYAALAGRLAADTGGLIVIFGTKADQAAAAEIAAAGAQVLDLTGKTSLALALACIARCHVFVTNDSGLMHSAAALNTPLVAVFGSTDHIATGPFSKQATVIRHSLPCSPCLKTHCPQGHLRCMELVSVEEVHQAVLELLDSPLPKPDKR